MTKLLQYAIELVSQLSENEQDAIAKMILAEIEDEQNWDDSFARSTVQLAQMAEDALADFKDGKTKSFFI